MIDVVEFKNKTTFGPTEGQLKAAQKSIADGAWPWHYQVNVYFAVTGCNKTIRRADLRKLVTQAYPVDSDGLPVNCAAINASLFTSIGRTIGGMNFRPDKLDGEWELCLVLAYHLESEFVAEHSILADFLNSMPVHLLEVQWQIDGGWVAVT